MQSFKAVEVCTQSEKQNTSPRFPPRSNRGRGFDSHRGQKKFFFASCGSLIPFTRANAQ